MADKEDWIVDGYQFESAKDAALAKAELLRIEKLEEKMDYRNPHMVYVVYHKAIENNIFKTPIGQEYLHKLQKKLKENSLVKEPVKDIPVNNIYNLRDSTSPAMEKVKASVKPKKKEPKKNKETFSRTTSICLNVVLAILVIVMFYISTTGTRPTILNYEKTIQNRYASWEQELSRREAVVREREKELAIQE